MTSRVGRFFRRHRKLTKVALTVIVLPSFLLLGGCGGNSEASDIPNEPPKSPYELEEMINSVKGDVKRVKLDIVSLEEAVGEWEGNADAIDAILEDIDSILSRLADMESTSATSTPSPTPTGEGYPMPTATSIPTYPIPTATPTSTAMPTPIYSLSLGSTTGGIVCKPQYPVTYYPYGEVVWIEARATIEGYVFEKWIGEATISNRSASETSVFMYGDWVLTASFIAAP